MSSWGHDMSVDIVVASILLAAIARVYTLAGELEFWT